MDDPETNCGADGWPEPLAYPVHTAVRVSGLGRSCLLFDQVRHDAYHRVCGFKTRNASETGFRSWVERIVVAGNAEFSIPLPASEVRSIAKSIAKWTWRHFSIEAFSHIQSRRRSSLKIKRANAVAEILKSASGDDGNPPQVSSNDLAAARGCSPRTARRYHATDRKSYEQSSLARRAPWKD